MFANLLSLIALDGAIAMTSTQNRTCAAVPKRTVSHHFLVIFRQSSFEDGLQVPLCDSCFQLLHAVDGVHCSSVYNTCQVDDGRKIHRCYATGKVVAVIAE